MPPETTTELPPRRLKPKSGANLNSGGNGPARPRTARANMKLVEEMTARKNSGEALTGQSEDNEKTREGV